MVIAAVIVKQVGSATIGGHQHVERSIVINVGVSSAASDFWAGKCGSEGSRHFLKLSAAEVAKNVRRLRIAYPLLHALDFVLDVSVGHENIGPAVVVVVKKETAEAQSHQGRAPDLRLRRLIHKEAVALIVVERKHLVGKVGDDKTGTAGPIIVGSVHAHASAGHAVFAECDSSRNSFFLKRPVVLVEVKLIRLGVIGQQDIGPAISVVI